MTGTILGIDPGIRGALAVVAIDPNGASPQLVDAIDVPTVGTGAAERVDVATVRDWILQHQPALALIERSQAMPRQGISSSFKYGRSAGQLEATVVLCAVPVAFIEPTKWKKIYNLHGGDKEAARQKALLLFPASHRLLALKRHHHRAESALIALTGAPSIPGVRPWSAS
jgi:crossover junction endodeoxyribonuclease RuvC